MFHVYINKAEDRTFENEYNLGEFIGVHCYIKEDHIFYLSYELKKQACFDGVSYLCEKQLYIFRNHKLMSVYEIEEIVKYYFKTYRPSYWSKIKKDHSIFRYDPVPGINNKRYRSFFKRPKTTQERRKSFECDSKYIRTKRNFQYLPNTWDDIYRTNGYKNKVSWKQTKKRKQWM